GLTTATYVRAGTSRIQNDNSGQTIITVTAGNSRSGIDLDAGIILSNGGSTQNFFKSGLGTMRVTNAANTGNFYIYQGALRVDDPAALGSGSVTLDGGNLVYGGTTAASTNKNLTLLDNSGIQVLTSGVNLTLNGLISESGSGRSLSVLGNNGNGTPPTLTLNANNTYSGATSVDGNVVLAVPTLPT